MRRYPSFRLPKRFVAVWQPDGGYIEAAHAIAANIRIAQQAGAVVRANERVVAIESRSRGVRIRTDHSDIEADGAVVAAGSWMKAILPDLNLPLTVTRQVVGWLEPRDAAPFGPERFPVFLIESAHGQHYGLPAYGSMGVKVARHHHLGEIVSPDACDRNVSANDEALIRAPLVDYLPSLDGPLLAVETCLYTMTPDGTFIIDHVPEFPHLVVASPCCGHGFKFSPVVGEIVADLVTRGTTDHDISPFRLGRFGGPVPSAGHTA
jgi:sarcosine oxidase